MNRNLLTSIFLPLLLGFPCAKQLKADHPLPVPAAAPALPAMVGDIPLPAGYQRVAAAPRSFAAWLRAVGIKKDIKVYLYNGSLKVNQQAQYAVLNIPLDKKDLQQCADAVMRLRAQYVYSQRRYSEISFSDNNGKNYTCPGPLDSLHFERYLEKVYSYCGTLSLEKQLKKVPGMTNVQPGDVLIKGGSPGHAVMVMDVAVNSSGNKVYLLAQSYMPAQDMHLLKNPMNGSLSPWYEVTTDGASISTPEWLFYPQQLRRW
jgi:hypothetical protein